ncbi:glycosyltransferase involved in cell wall biosynthesis [Pseudochelatococcus lubricantis]|uniref:Glycosyltransferase involved in cell wall biosynthesis n=1 Tax=Pseudochelatococcus lubricantis TaxID=1538102 RepID=A0ABX0UYQ0_9HYPH|nr:glycosyltransferase family 2 protein [Pseudochelatococcus lubricantis]NIJ58057.1 glycosyltransferase involved in cell wall biosynthesis [Pseudochelatococcus lubricantis]
MLLSIVTPFYNEEEAIDAFFSRLTGLLDRTLPAYDFEFVCVDDGSRDRTLEILKARAAADARVRVVELARNFGKEAALTAGLTVARGDAVIPIDADLQDPPEIIPEMVRLWADEGYDVVEARRADRSSDTWLKRFSAESFYKLNNAIAETPIPENTGDFRLMSRRVVDVINALPERQRFMKGIFAWVGFRRARVEFVREQRVAGSTKWNKWRLWNLALEGITSFSTWPLRVWTYVGAAIAGLAFLYGLILIVSTLIGGRSVPGYASLMSAILFMGGVQLIGIGILGEYLGRTYLETKQRPVFVIREIYGRGEGGQQEAAHGGAPGGAGQT